MSIAIWPSAVRIVATLLVFAYHYLSLVGRLQSYPTLNENGYNICALFLFISGYYSIVSKGSPHKWLARRVVGILVPYWVVIVPVLCANYIYKYKPALPWEYVAIFLGGSMFLDNPVYVISWFVTLILLLYTMVYFSAILTGCYKAMPYVACFAILHYGFRMDDVLFLSFVAGYAVRVALPARTGSLADRWCWHAPVANALFGVQSFCYSFFLVHGAVLVVAVKLFPVNYVFTPLASVVLTALISVPHKRISDRGTAKLLGLLGVHPSAKPAPARS